MATYLGVYADSYGPYQAGGTTPVIQLAAPSGLSLVAMAGSNGASWNQVANASAYRLQRALVAADGTIGSYSIVYEGTATSYSDATATAGQRYAYRVKALGTGSYSDSDYATPAVQVVTAGSTARIVRFNLGDSKTFGDTLANADTDSWPAQETALLPANYAEFHKLARNGYQAGPESFQYSVLYEEVPAAIALINALPADVTLVHCFLWVGVNDGNYSRTVADVFADIKTALARLKAACVAVGIQFLASGATLDPCGRQYGSATLAEFAAYRDEFDRRYLNEYNSLGLFNIFNNASDARKNDVNDTTYFNDKLHESKAGQAVNAANYAVITQATCEGRALPPAPSIGATTPPPSTTPVVDTQLTRSAVAYQDPYNASLDSTRQVATCTVNPGTSPSGGGFNSFAASSIGFGPTSGNIIGLIKIPFQSGQGEIIASASRTQTNFLPDTFDVDNLNAAWHGISDTIEQTLGQGTGATIANQQNTTPAGSNDELIVQFEKYRTVWFKNGQLFLNVAQDNSSGTLWPEFFFKGKGSFLANVTIAAANPVTRTGGGGGGTGTQHFATYTAGALDGQGGWQDFGATKSLISSDGLTLDPSSSYDKSDKGLLLPTVFGNVEAILTVKGGANSRPLLCIHYSESKNGGLCFWYAGGSGFDGGIIGGGGSVAHFRDYNTVIGSIPPPPADTYCMSARYVGNTIEFRVWAASASRPATAQYSYELQDEEIIASGKVRLGVIGSATLVTDLTIS